MVVAVVLLTESCESPLSPKPCVTLADRTCGGLQDLAFEIQLAAVEKIYDEAGRIYPTRPRTRGCPTPAELVLAGAIRPGQAKDVWGGDIRIRCYSGFVNEVRSAGPDGIMENVDDVVRRFVGMY
ncbi:MAG: hypothetical protein HY905_19565 [Deltaproteobacteria bacterium]|nr:hypothetical protein [Deltaproteobacteria bacterium]